MTAAEGEWGCFRRNVDAQGLDAKAGVKKAIGPRAGRSRYVDAGGLGALGRKVMGASIR